MQPDDVGDHPRGRPRGLLPDVAGGACERSRLQHPAAAEHRRALQTIIRRLDQVLCPVYARHHQEPDLALDHDAEKMKVGIKHESRNFNFNFQSRKATTLDFNTKQIQN